MANAKRGRIPIELDGDGYELRFPTSVMRGLQERFEVKTPNEVWQKLNVWSSDDWVEVIHAGLSKGSHPDISREEVDDLVLGTELNYYAAVILDAVTSSLRGRAGGRVQEMMDKMLAAVGSVTEKGGDVKAVKEAIKEVVAGGAAQDPQ